MLNIYKSLLITVLTLSPFTSWASEGGHHDRESEVPQYATSVNYIHEGGSLTYDQFKIQRRAPSKEAVLGFCHGINGYTKNTAAAREINELLIDQIYPDAFNIKIEGLAYGMYGYEKNPKAAKELNENLVLKGDHDAISRKKLGLENGMYGYAKALKSKKLPPSTTSIFTKDIRPTPISVGGGWYRFPVGSKPDPRIWKHSGEFDDRYKKRL